MRIKNILNVILTIIAPLTGAPTAWAIFAGITNREAFPMNDVVALLGAFSILVVDIGVALLMADSYSFKQSAKGKEEKQLVQPLWWSMVIFVVAILSEIVLSLVIVVVPQIKAYGVIVFPLMTTAGAFTVAARIDLNSRELERQEAREEEQRRKDEANERRRATIKANKQAKLEKQQAKKKETEKKEKQIEVKKEEVYCKICGYGKDEIITKKQLAGHMRAHPVSERKNGHSKEPIKDLMSTIWICPECKTVNNSERETCRKCESVKV